MQSTLGWALKEWDIVCAALLEGKQAMLLRKGGILEAENEFVLEHAQFLLFPTFMHQDQAGTKAEWRGRMVRVARNRNGLLWRVGRRSCVLLRCRTGGGWMS